MRGQGSKGSFNTEEKWGSGNDNDKKQSQANRCAVQLRIISTHQREESESSERDASVIKRNEIDIFIEMSEHTEKRLNFLTVFEEHKFVMSAQKTKQLKIEII